MSIENSRRKQNRILSDSSGAAINEEHPFEQNEVDLPPSPEKPTMVTRMPWESDQNQQDKDVRLVLDAKILKQAVVEALSEMREASVTLGTRARCAVC